MGMPAEVQAVVMDTLQTVFMRDTSPGAEVAGPASFHPNHRTIAEQLETTTKSRDEAIARVHELESQVTDLYRTVAVVHLSLDALRGHRLGYRLG